MNGIFYISDFPSSLLLGGLALGCLLLLLCWDYIQNKILNEDLVYDIVIEVNNKKIEVEAILDTGNSLKDPISNCPVIVVEYEAMRLALPDKLSHVFKDSRNDVNFDELCSLLDNTDWVFRIRLIPFSSLGKQNGMLIGIKPDNVILNNKKCHREIRDVVIGIYNNKISKNGEYRALLYPEIIN